MPTAPRPAICMNCWARNRWGRFATWPVAPGTSPCRLRARLPAIVGVDAAPGMLRQFERMARERIPRHFDALCAPEPSEVAKNSHSSQHAGVHGLRNVGFWRFRGRGLPAEAVQAYAEGMPLPSNSFDAVMSRLSPGGGQSGTSGGGGTRRSVSNALAGAGNGSCSASRSAVCPRRKA